MNLPIPILNKIMEDELPPPGSINFTNAVDEISVPLFKNWGILSVGNPDDISGMEPGTRQLLKEQYATLVFRKNVKDECWDLVILNDELQHKIDRSRLLIREYQFKRNEILDKAIEQGKTIQDIYESLTGSKYKKPRKKK